MSTFEEHNPADISIETILPHIQHHLPNITPDQIRFHYHGSYNVFIVDDRYIFRFPDRAFRNDKGKAMIHDEKEKLDKIRSKVNQSIPKPQFFGLKPDLPYVGYEMIPGVSLSHCLKSFSSQNQVTIASQIGNFLSQLHSSSLSAQFEIKKTDFKSYEEFPQIYKDQWAQLFQKTQKCMYSLFTKDQKIWIEQIFTEFLSEPSNFQFEPCLIHGDFDTSNILVDPIFANLTGIIDFEDCKLYDPAVDLLFFDEGSDFLEEIINHYTAYKVDQPFRNRMKFLYSRTCLSYIEWGMDNNRSELVQAGLKIMEKNMNQFPLQD
ncbi:phosphotransferase family protein [Candidatus Lokiarchaeum ossiferum]|uniref:phosphotransferase family protein n=1 Tax=Candidatus Lokiarchaeum ossiferum TaxID=2951803 RepID=UPI00352EA78E